MTDTTPTLPREALRGFASGVIFMAVFGTLWGSIGVGGLAGWGAPWPTVVVLALGVALLAGGLVLWRGAGRADAAADGAGDSGTNRQFILVFAAEGLAIGIASAVCNATDHFERFFPIMALIVGLHFFPLARLFASPLYILTGALLCAVGLATLTVVPVSATLGGWALMPRWLVAGWCCAAILWATGVVRWRQGTRALHLAVHA